MKAAAALSSAEHRLQLSIYEPGEYSPEREAAAEVDEGTTAAICLEQAEESAMQVRRQQLQPLDLHR